jgi:hypothetical protein
MPGVNFTNILRAAFAPIFLRTKSKNLKSKYKKASYETFVRQSRAYNVGEIDTRSQFYQLLKFSFCALRYKPRVQAQKDVYKKCSKMLLKSTPGRKTAVLCLTSYSTTVIQQTRDPFSQI